MKKIFFLLIACVVIISLSSCRTDESLPLENEKTLPIKTFSTEKMDKNTENWKSVEDNINTKSDSTTTINQLEEEPKNLPPKK